jgi:hypothetical protein
MKNTTSKSQQAKVTKTTSKEALLNSIITNNSFTDFSICMSRCVVIKE